MQKPRLRGPTKLPVNLYKYFWDVDAASLNPAERPQYVISRLLDKGNLEAARWVLSTYSNPVIVRAVTGSRDFSVKSATFWGLYFGIAREDFKCMQQPYQRMRLINWIS